MICRECIKQVDSACVIKRKCVQTDLMLRQKIKTFVEPVELPIEEEYYANPMDDDFLDDDVDAFLDEHESCDENPEIIKDHQITIIVENHPNWQVVLESEIIEAQEIEEQRQEAIRQKLEEEFTAAPEKVPKCRPEDFLCMFCGAVFAQVGQRQLHVREEHADELECRICNKRKISSKGTDNCLRQHQYGSKFLCQVIRSLPIEINF